jgi:quercetin dioxygenase-like cupin family protein
MAHTPPISKLPLSEETALMRIPKLVCDGDGGSRFEELDVAQTTTPYAQNAPPVLVSEALAANAVVFVTLPGDIRQIELHPAPRRQLVVVLDGEFVIGTTDGDKRTLTPGMIALVEDVEGRGHTTTVRSAGPATFLAIPLAN